MTLEYICTHYGEEEIASKYDGAVNMPLIATSLHAFSTVEELLAYNKYENSGKYIYGRVDNPTVVLLEKKLAAIEGAERAVAFASGMAAITAALLYGVRPGKHLICVTNAYGPTRTFINKNLKEWGVDCTYVSGVDIKEFEEAIQENTSMIYLESPTSVMMELQDLEKVAALAKTHKLVTAIDNTWAAGVYQKPLQLGIDISVHTMSKYYGGHSDLIGGVLCTNEEIALKIRDEGREVYGGILGTWEAWMVLRSLRTLPERLRKSGSNALAIARFLEESDKVERINYPGVASYKQYELANKQLTGCSGLLSFSLKADVTQTKTFVNRLKLFYKGVSWGGFESLVCMPMHNSSEDECIKMDSTRNLVRIYCGLEHEMDLINDIKQALQAIE